MFQVIGNGEDTGSSEEDPVDIFEVFATERKKCKTRHSKLPEMQLPTRPSAPTSAEPSSPVPVPSTAIPTTSTSAAASAPAQMAPQYRYQSTAEDQRLVSELESWLMEGKLTQTTPTHVLAASPSIQKDLVEKLWVHHIEAGSYEETVETFTNNAADWTNQVLRLQEPAYSLPLHEIEVEIGNKVVEMGVINPGSQIIVIWEDLA